MNKRHRQERSKSAVQGRQYTQQRISLGEEAKQALRNMSLINNNQERTYQEWNKEEDAFSISSFHIYRSQVNTTHKKGKLKKGITHTRSSTPVMATAAIQRKKQERKQLVPFNLDIQSGSIDKRIHSVPEQHNFVGGKIQLFKEIIYKKITPVSNRSFRPTSLPLPRGQLSNKSLRNYLELNSRNGCKQIVPLKMHQLGGIVREGKDSKMNENIVSNKANLIRKLLKQQRKNNFNYCIFRKQPIKPQF